MSEDNCEIILDLSAVKLIGIMSFVAVIPSSMMIMNALGRSYSNSLYYKSFWENLGLVVLFMSLMPFSIYLREFVKRNGYWKVCGGDLIIGDKDVFNANEIGDIIFKRRYFFIDYLMFYGRGRLVVVSDFEANGDLKSMYEHLKLMKSV